jgi:hypothetical protein
MRYSAGFGRHFKDTVAAEHANPAEYTVRYICSHATVHDISLAESALRITSVLSLLY